MVIKPETNILYIKWRLSTAGDAESSSFQRRSNLRLCKFLLFENKLDEIF